MSLHRQPGREMGLRNETVALTKLFTPENTRSFLYLQLPFAILPPIRSCSERYLEGSLHGKSESTPLRSRIARRHCRQSAGTIHFRVTHRDRLRSVASRRRRGRYQAPRPVLGL